MDNEDAVGNLFGRPFTAQRRGLLQGRDGDSGD
jgi:hypothetical protein